MKRIPPRLSWLVGGICVVGCAAIAACSDDPAAPTPAAVDHRIDDSDDDAG